VESNHHSRRRRLYRPLSSPHARRSRGEGRPTGFEPAPQGSRPRMLPLHHGHHVRGSGERTVVSRGRAVRPRNERPFARPSSARTTGFEPAASRWTAGRSSPLSYVRVRCAGGIRTHGLELMRLARTASPLPRSLPGWIRTSALRFPKPAGCPASLQADRHTPGGTRTRNFPVESRASSPFDHRGSLKRETVGGAGIEPALARYQRAVPPRTPTSDQELRRQDSNPPFAINSRASYPLDHAGMKETRKERESNPQGREAHPLSRRDTAPVAVLPNDGPGRSRTCTVPIKSRQLYPVELRNQRHVAGRIRTCGAPRFRRPLYPAELRPRGWARLDSNQQPLVCETSTLRD
jgi:hypothetical protein